MSQKKILTSSYSASFQEASLIKDQIMAFLILARVPYLIVDDITSGKAKKVVDIGGLEKFGEKTNSETSFKISFNDMVEGKQ